MTAYRLDHLAIAVPRWEDTGRYLTEHLGAQWKHGFTGVPQFHPAQLSLRDARRLELLEPDGDKGSFVQRFLEGSGMRPRVHHLTFYVPSIEEVIERIRGVGLSPQQVRIDNDVWREAFVHPKDSRLGILAQVVEVASDPAVGSDGEASPFLCQPPEWAAGEETTSEPAAFEHIVGEVDDLTDARRLLVDVLGAREREVDGVPRPTRTYSWSEGPSIVMEEGAATDGPRITALVVSRSAGGAAFDPDTAEAALRAPLVPELGVRLVEV